jgi:hypothetical protein
MTTCKKALTLYQPLAASVVYGFKKWETRGFRTKYRGELLIHASKNEEYFFRLGFDPFTKFFDGKNIELATGAIIGKVDLVDCISTEEWFDMTIREKWTNSQVMDEIGFGNYDAKRFAWKLENPVVFEKPIPARGSLSLWSFHQCRECGCSDGDPCISKEFGTCWWEPDDQNLCSFCLEKVENVRRDYSTFVIKKEVQHG